MVRLKMYKKNLNNNIHNLLTAYTINTKNSKNQYMA